MTMKQSLVETMPVISITAECLPEAWEKAVLAVWDQGYEVKTQYDKPGDPPSKDATVMIAVTDPFNEPRIHKNFPGGPEELEAYRQEVVSGIHDHWIDPAGASGPTPSRAGLSLSPEVTFAIPRAPSPSSRSTRSIHHRQPVPAGTPAGPCRHRKPRPTRRRTIRRAHGSCAGLADESGGLDDEQEHPLAKPRPLKAVFHGTVYALTDHAADDRGSDRPHEGEPVAWVATSKSATPPIYGSYLREAAVEIEKCERRLCPAGLDSIHPAFEMMTQGGQGEAGQGPGMVRQARG
jgi:hypothetical protein